MSKQIEVADFNDLFCYKKSLVQTLIDGS